MWLKMRCVYDLGSWTIWQSSAFAFLHKFCLVLFWLRLPSLTIASETIDTVSFWSAVIRYEYLEPTNSSQMVIEQEMGRYGLGSSIRWQDGVVVHVEEETGLNHGCSPYINNIPQNHERWIALVERGDCRFQQKVHQAFLHNASALVIYNHIPEDDLLTMLHNETHIVSVFIGHEDGLQLAELVDRGIEVHMNISMGKIIEAQIGPNTLHTSLLLTFVGFLIIGLVVVVIYAVKHAKHVHAKHQARLNMCQNMTMNEGQHAQDHLLPAYTVNGNAGDVTIHTTTDVRVNNPADATL